jgi:hypothetical protein
MLDKVFYAPNMRLDLLTKYLQMKKQKLNKTRINLTIDRKLKARISKQKKSKTFAEFFTDLAEKFLAKITK